MERTLIEKSSERLFDLLKNEKIILWVGSGLSEASDYPDWEKALISISKR